jgi:hypothetical protein
MFRVVILAAVVVLAAFVWSIWRRARLQRQVINATAEFVRRRPQLQEDFRAAADVLGKPRGLRWKSCEFQDGLTLARDRANGELLGLVGATIGFEAVEGGGMEEVEAVSNLRAATAILTWTGHDWTTTGRAVFNLEPREVLEHYRQNLAAIST